MGKNFKLNDIFDALSSVDRVAQPNQFIYFLGTDTRFTPCPTRDDPDPVKRKFYERGELQSYAAQVMVQLFEEEGQHNPGASLSYSSLSVDVLDGPNTLATNVGDKIAEGIYLVLYAVACGKSEVHITAHSRGGCEAILVMHELARLRKVLKEVPQKNFSEMLLETPCPYTRIGLKKIVQNSALDTPHNRLLLVEKLDRLTLNSVLIDPVPGTGMGIGSWNDQRFYWSLDGEGNINGNHLVLLMQHESSALFSPIGIRESDRVEVLLHPGTHANCTGNQYSHNYGRPSGMEQLDLSGAQDLALYHLFKFYSEKINLFNNFCPVDTGHLELDTRLNNFLLANEDGKVKQYFELYQNIHENKAIYDWLAANSSYTSISRGERGRYVLVNGQYVQMGDFFHDVPDQFVNWHHASVYLKQIFGVVMDDKRDSLSIVKHIQTLIDKFFQAMELGSGDLNPSPLAVLLDEELGQNYGCHCIKTLVNRIGGHLLDGLVEDQRRQLMSLVSNLMNNLDDKVCVGDEKAAKLKEKLQTTLRAGLKEVVYNHTKSLLLQKAELYEQVVILYSIETVFAAELGFFMASLKLSFEKLSEQSDDEVALQVSLLINSLINRLKGSTVSSLEELQCKISLILSEEVTSPVVINKFCDVIYSAYSPNLKRYSDVYVRIKQDFNYESELSQLKSAIEYRRDNLENLRLLISGSRSLDSVTFNHADLLNADLLNADLLLNGAIRLLEHAQTILETKKADQEEEVKTVLRLVDSNARSNSENLQSIREALTKYSDFWKFGHNHKEPVKDLLAKFDQYTQPTEVVTDLKEIIAKEKANPEGDLCRLTNFFNAQFLTSGGRPTVRLG